jgi:hypothetical protein
MEAPGLRIGRAYRIHKNRNLVLPLVVCRKSDNLGLLYSSLLYYGIVLTPMLSFTTTSL